MLQQSHLAQGKTQEIIPSPRINRKGASCPLVALCYNRPMQRNAVGTPLDKPALYSIGHSNVPFEQLLARLRQHGIATVCDVRSTPYSRHNPQFNRETLAGALIQAGLGYHYLGDALGGLAGKPAPTFQHGLAELIALGAQAPTVFMCAEADYHNCHRQRLITPALIEQGVTVWHIVGDGRLERGEVAPEQSRMF